MKIPAFHNIIFDLDGTLLDSKRDIAAAQLFVLKQFGIHHHKPEDIYPHIGKTTREIYEIFLPTEFHNRLQEAHEIYLNYYRPRALETTQLFPGVREALIFLHSNRIRLSVATTKSTMTTQRILDHFGISRFFDQVQDTDGTPSKPDPYIINKIVTDRFWIPVETLMVGDSDRDIEAGRNAGIRTCGVTYGAFTRLQMEQCHPDYIIDDIFSLTTIIFQS